MTFSGLAALSRSNPPQKADELIMDDLDDLLAGRDALQDLLARALGLDPLDELPGYLEMHVGREEGGADLAQRRGHVLLGELADTAQVSQCGGQFIGQGIKHGEAHRMRNRRPRDAIPGIAFGMANRGGPMRRWHPS